MAGIEAGNAEIIARGWARLPARRRTAVLTGRVGIDLDATDVEVYGRLKRGVAYNYLGQGDRPKPWEINCSSARGVALRRELGRLAVMGEAGIPAGEVGDQVVVEDPGADLQEQMGALW